MSRGKRVGDVSGLEQERDDAKRLRWIFVDEIGREGDPEGNGRRKDDGQR